MAELLKPGRAAPQFRLTDKDGNPHTLKEIDADFTVLYFYPKDNTPGCTIQSKQFSKDLLKFKKVRAQVIGISGGDQRSKTNFCRKHSLSVTLLSDPDFAVAKKYGVYGKKKFMGREFMGIFRVTYLLDKRKKVIKVYNSVSPATNSKELLKDIRGLMREVKSNES